MSKKRAPDTWKQAEIFLVAALIDAEKSAFRRKEPMIHKSKQKYKKSQQLASFHDRQWQVETLVLAFLQTFLAL